MRRFRYGLEGEGIKGNLWGMREGKKGDLWGMREGKKREEGTGGGSRQKDF